MKTNEQKAWWVRDRRGSMDIVSSRGEVIANVAGQNPTNGQLIAAAPDMSAALDACDTAFAVISISEGLTSQARAALLEGWAAVQEAIVKARPGSAYAQAALELEFSALNIQRKKKAEQLALARRIREGRAN